LFEPSDAWDHKQSRKRFALCASHFSCVAKKSNQKKVTLTVRPTMKPSGGQAAREFSECTSMCHPKTARVARAALGVLPGPLAAPYGIGTGNSNSTSNSNVAPHRSSPALRAREEAGSNSNRKINVLMSLVFNPQCH